MKVAAATISDARQRPLRLELDGTRPTARQLAAFALANDGHYTVAQVRAGAIRGLELHLERLHGASLELYSTPLEPGSIRALIRHALRGITDATLRVTIAPAPAGGLSTMVSVRAPADPPKNPQRLTIVDYQRPLAHLKHVGTFAQIEYARRAARDGADDALLTRDGWIRETTAANIGFAFERAIVWPSGPLLQGITMRLLDAQLRSAEFESTVRPLGMKAVRRARGAFLANSSGLVAVERIGDISIPVNVELMTWLRRLYLAVPADQVGESS